MSLGKDSSPGGLAVDIGASVQNRVEPRLLYKLVVVGLSTLSRLVASVLLFALVARSAGLEDFGVFTYWYAIGTLGASISDYGFGQQVLKDLAGAELPKARSHALSLLCAKGWISGGIFGAALVFAFASSSSASEAVAGAVLIASGMAGSFFDYLAMVLRSRSALRAESALAAGASIGASVMAGLAAYISSSILIAAIALFLVRIAFVVVEARLLFGSVLYVEPQLRVAKNSPRSTLKRSLPFALDNLALQLFANLDVLMVKFLLGPQSSGVYLAGTRLTQASLAGLPVIASIFLPMLSSQRTSLGDLWTLRKKAILISCLAGLSILGGFVALQSVAPSIIFGDAFVALGDLMPFFGGYLCIRYFAAGPSLLLTALGRQSARALATSLGVLAAFMYIGIAYSMTAVIQPLDLCFMMIVGAGVQFAAYIFLGRGLQTQISTPFKE
ncbi:lipopolysaccharide biosynthesis protein [Denitromonas halophila]|uniref:Oligosaccharide flippase family protein n=1 Tax=Denitromonas halophila TaxID=1629404 RepID=A0A557QXH7_9RHOO|nr:oligosaccharide flippase family protein [Denitromonas halophila]TVO57622.1 oligosaccharide flippase family protein [Denitromonas halophila]